MATAAAAIVAIPPAPPAAALVAAPTALATAPSATGSAVSTAEDPQRASDDAEGAIVLVLAGIRSLVESGADVPTAADLAPHLAPERPPEPGARSTGVTS